ncbi:unnamed protein product [Prorocentrum cordatum]|uniref:Uncharacterized protein n=1 Tax=Prorocentrum cordatum TaxID=2364126 RepID=A0ABN9T0V7_9DINO|nr:unnamed protein product [Polarella glacialis]
MSWLLKMQGCPRLDQFEGRRETLSLGGDAACEQDEAALLQQAALGAASAGERRLEGMAGPGGACAQGTQNCHIPQPGGTGFQVVCPGTGICPTSEECGTQASPKHCGGTQLCQVGKCQVVCPNNGPTCPASV